MTIIKPRWTVGALIAPLTAGPVFMASGGLVALYADLPKPVVLELDALGQYMMAMIPAIPFGWIFAVIPCCLGAAAMGHIGVRYPATRSIRFWILAGMALTMLPAFILAPTTDRGLAAAFVFGCCGAICAALCHRFTTWDGDPLVPPVRSPARAVSPLHPEQ